MSTSFLIYSQKRVMMSDGVEELGDVINYLMGFTKLVKIYSVVANAFSHEALVNLESKILLSLGCVPICNLARREEYFQQMFYSLYYQCDDLIVALKERLNIPPGFPNFLCERDPLSPLIKKGIARFLPYPNFFVDFGTKNGSIEIGLKDEVSISLRLDNISFIRVGRIHGYSDNSVTIEGWESKLESPIDIYVKLAKGSIERKNIKIEFENMENLTYNPETAYKLAASLLTQLYKNPTFRSSMDKVTSFLERFLRAHTTMILY